MTSLCLIPLVFASYTHSIQTSWHHSANIGGPSAEFQTCRDGLGARLAFNEHFVQAGPQWGWTIPFGDDWSVTLNVHGGLGYSNTHHPLSGVRQVTKFNGGLSVSLNVDRYSVKVGYDHLSNGKGVSPVNVGQDLASIGVGYSF
jgi:hypothetical protein